MADLGIWERLASDRSSSGTASLKHGADRLAAALANSSALTFPATLPWAGARRMVTSLSRASNQPQTSIAAMTKRCPEPRASDLTRSMAAVEPTKTV